MFTLTSDIVKVGQVSFGQQGWELNFPHGYSSLWAAMANFALANRDNNTFDVMALQYFNFGSIFPKEILVTNVLDDGYAAIRWYKVHNDERFLQRARHQWNFAYHLTISQETKSPNGNMAGKVFPLAEDCGVQGISANGATFRNSSENDVTVGTYESSQYSLLSALLAEADPSNTTYAHAASLSLEFALGIAGNFSYSVTGNGDLVNYAGNCGNPSDLNLLQTRGTSSYGTMIEAMSIIHSLYESNNTDTRLQQVINSTLYTVGGSLGLGSNGVLFNDNTSQAIGGDSGDMYFLRGLAEAYRRGEGTLSAELRDQMKIVLGVHYNAIRESATTGNNVYSRNWRGPPTQTTFDSYNQAAAAQILVDGIDLFPSNDIIRPPNNTGPPNITGPPNSRPSAAVIAGSTTGSVLFLLSVVLFVIYAVRHWRRKHQTALSSDAGPTAQVIKPFIATISGKQIAPSQKYPPRQMSAQVTASAARISPSRRHDSALPATQETTDLMSERHSTIDARNIERLNVTGDAGSRRQEHTPAGEDLEITPAFPDMVRMVYQRLWAHNVSENPPDYRSNLGEPPQQA
ncbi:hypothetical protein PQX77_008979 [Marasmius sp. AFHP31]|nr:hypothetical protein PQX77_008979 [Marasmius sp. AFHP31]